MKNFSRIRLSLASPKDIRDRSYGEITKPETINYRTLVPEKGGLFCEAIHGPIKDWQCACGKYKRIRFKGIVCEKCSVEVTKSKVRRERMGHIELAVPVAHIWYAKGSPNIMSTLLGITSKDLESVVYFGKYIIINPGNSVFKKYQIIGEYEYRAELDNGKEFKIGMGAEAILECLEGLDLEQMKVSLKTELDSFDSVHRRKKIVKRLDVIKSFITSGNRPEWMILQALPVMPADLRPMVQLDGGRFATSDLNDLYRRVINRNKRLIKLKRMFAPEIILKNEKRMLQEAVDALIDNSRRDVPAVNQNNRGLKSLSDMLKGKQGRFRQNLLGKRVDYSGRSVIVSGPGLKLNQCGIPKKMALELYKPFIMRSLVERGYATNIKFAKKLVEAEHHKVWEVAEDVIKGHPVLLNRAPSLHKLSIQAFDPVLIDGKAIRLHPLVCSAYNADFDGDTMSVHVVLSPESIMEAKTMMYASSNMISSANGKPIVSPSREMLIGCYYVTNIKPGQRGEGKSFGSINQAISAYNNEVVEINAAIRVRIEDELIETTAGRVLLNELLPMKFRDYTKAYADKDFKKLIANLYKEAGASECSEIVNNIKDFGFKHATLSGITIGIEDLVIPSEKKEMIEKADKKVHEIYESYKRGEIVEMERMREVIDTWNTTIEVLTEQLIEEINPFNPVFMMSKSGARGNLTQMRQLSGMKGLVSDTQGRVMEVPIKSNFREGLSVLEFFMSSHGARKGSADRALRTADSGYLTRRLVDVAHDVIINSEDCGTSLGIEVSALELDNVVIQTLAERIQSRVLAEDILHNGETLALKGELIHEDKAKMIEKAGVTSAKIRSTLTCELVKGLCRKCYGLDLAINKKVSMGEAVGVIAAQSIGEPGTQLTMRTFHTGGVSEQSAADKQLFAGVSGTVNLSSLKYIEAGNKLIVTVTSKIKVDNESYNLMPGSILSVKDKQKVEKGDILANLNPHAWHIIAEKDGYLDYVELVINERVDKRFNVEERTVIKGFDKASAPQILLRKDKKGDVIDQYPLPVGAFLIHKNGTLVKKGSVIAKVLRDDEKTRKDITGGLPKVQQLFEVRMPQIRAMISDIDGEVKILEEKRKGMRVLQVKSDTEIREYLMPMGERILVENDQKIAKGGKLTEGSIFVNDVLSVFGTIKAQAHLLESVQKIYREQDVYINDKHIEIIVKQMFRKVRITDPGSSFYLEGEIISKREADSINEALRADENKLLYEPIIQGITKAAVDTESFISAASFQETTKVLANAAVRGSADILEGLKENVIIGRRIPAGTGQKSYVELEEAL